MPLRVCKQFLHPRGTSILGMQCTVLMMKINTKLWYDMKFRWQNLSIKGTITIIVNRSIHMPSSGAKIDPTYTIYWSSKYCLKPSAYLQTCTEASKCTPTIVDTWPLNELMSPSGLHGTDRVNTKCAYQLVSKQTNLPRPSHENRPLLFSSHLSFPLRCVYLLHTGAASPLDYQIWGSETKSSLVPTLTALYVQVFGHPGFYVVTNTNHSTANHFIFWDVHSINKLWWHNHKYWPKIEF